VVNVAVDVFAVTSHVHPPTVRIALIGKAKPTKALAVSYTRPCIVKLALTLGANNVTCKLATEKLAAV